MNIYLVKRTDDIGYDEYDSMVVVAYNEESARKLNPNDGYFFKDNKWFYTGYQGKIIQDDKDYSWVFANKIHELTVLLIGITDLYQVERVILSSFNAAKEVMKKNIFDISQKSYIRPLLISIIQVLEKSLLPYSSFMKINKKGVITLTDTEKFSVSLDYGKEIFYIVSKNYVNKRLLNIENLKLIEKLFNLTNQSYNKKEWLENIGIE